MVRQEGAQIRTNVFDRDRHLAPVQRRRSPARPGSPPPSNPRGRPASNNRPRKARLVTSSQTITCSSSTIQTPPPSTRSIPSPSVGSTSTNADPHSTRDPANFPSPPPSLTTVTGFPRWRHRRREGVAVRTTYARLRTVRVSRRKARGWTEWGRSRCGPDKLRKWKRYGRSRSPSMLSTNKVWVQYNWVGWKHLRSHASGSRSLAIQTMQLVTSSEPLSVFRTWLYCTSTLKATERPSSTIWLCPEDCYLLLTCSVWYSWIKMQAL